MFLTLSKFEWGCFSCPKFYLGCCIVQWWSLDTWSRSRDHFFPVSVSKDFDLGLELLVWRLCMGYFFMKSCKKQFLKKRIYKVIVQNSAVQSGQWLCCLSCYGENNLPSTLFKICAEFTKNNVCTSETAARNFCNACNETLGVRC